MDLFIFTRDKDDSAFVPNSINHVCVGFMRYLRADSMSEIDIQDFNWYYVDSEMKRLQVLGMDIA